MRISKAENTAADYIQYNIGTKNKQHEQGERESPAYTLNISQDGYDKSIEKKSVVETASEKEGKITIITGKEESVAEIKEREKIEWMTGIEMCIGQALETSGEYAYGTIMGALGTLGSLLNLYLDNQEESISTGHDTYLHGILERLNQADSEGKNSLVSRIKDMVNTTLDGKRHDVKSEAFFDANDAAVNQRDMHPLEIKNYKNETKPSKHGQISFRLQEIMRDAGETKDILAEMLGKENRQEDHHRITADEKILKNALDEFWDRLSEKYFSEHPSIDRPPTPDSATNIIYSLLYANREMTP